MVVGIFVVAALALIGMGGVFLADAFLHPESGYLGAYIQDLMMVGAAIIVSLGIISGAIAVHLHRSHRKEGKSTFSIPDVFLIFWVVAALALIGAGGFSLVYSFLHPASGYIGEYIQDLMTVGAAIIVGLGIIFAAIAVHLHRSQNGNSLVPC